MINQNLSPTLKKEGVYRREGTSEGHMKLEIEQQDALAIAQHVADILTTQMGGVSSSSCEILDVGELATMLKVAKSWVYKQVQYKSIPHFKVGKFPRFKRKEIEAWIIDQSLPSTKAAYPKLKSRGQ